MLRRQSRMLEMLQATRPLLPGHPFAKLACAISVLALLQVCGCVFPDGAHAGELATRIRACLPADSPSWLTVTLMSALPLIELRGAIPIGINVLGMEPLQALAFAVLGNMLPVPIILLGLGPLSSALSNIPACKRAFHYVFERARKQGAAWKENEFWALALFVGVPLPGTGAWSGAIGAFVLGMPFHLAIAANFAGVVIAGSLMVALTLMGWYGFYVAAAVLLGAPMFALGAKHFRPKQA